MRNAPIEEEEEYSRRENASALARELCARAIQLASYARAMCEEFVVTADEADDGEDTDDCPAD